MIIMIIILNWLVNDFTQFIQYGKIFIIFVSIFILGVNMASPQYGWQNKDIYTVVSGVKNGSSVGHEKFSASTSSSSKTITEVGHVLYVPSPSMPCTTDSDCTEGYDLPVECRSGHCECQQPYCWVYTYQKNGIFAEFKYNCGKCGQLGSECYGTITCDPPGYCGSDKFCHCKRGEHKEDVCLVSKENYLTQFLLACVFIILFLIASALAYQTFWSVRHHGRFCWCRMSNFSRRRGRRRGRSSRQYRTHPHNKVVKTPAYTAQQRIYQNFHQRNDSESESDEDVTEENIEEEKDPKTDTKSTLIDMDIIRTTDERDLHRESIELRTFPMKTAPLEEERPTSTETEDVTGMTDYYNTYSTQL